MKITIPLEFMKIFRARSLRKDYKWAQGGGSGSGSGVGSGSGGSGTTGSGNRGGNGNIHSGTMRPGLLDN